MCVWFVLSASCSSLGFACVASLHLVSEQVVHGIRFALVVACFASRLARHLHGLCAMTLVVEDGIEVLHNVCLCLGSFALPTRFNHDGVGHASVGALLSDTLADKVLALLDDFESGGYAHSLVAVTLWYVFTCNEAGVAVRCYNRSVVGLLELL